MEYYINKWMMYHEIHRHQMMGMKAAQIASQFVMDTRTVKKILAMNENEYEAYRQRLSSRARKLASYEEFVRKRLEQCRQASSAQVHDWLKESYPDFPAISVKSVYNFVLYVRNKYQLLKPFDTRSFNQVEELPYGAQAQVDFGEYNMTDAYGIRKKVYFFALVLSRSRYKFVMFSDHPFTTESAIAAHERAFAHIDGYPGELVYDQDTLLLVSENKGNLSLTHAFRAYHQSRPFKFHFCRKSDPQSKGKIENVIKYIKYNFLRGRIYYDIYTLNAQALEWLERTANAKEHSTTRKIPHQEWINERIMLFPLQALFESTCNQSVYQVAKDNVIHYKGSSYTVPDGTFRYPKTEVIVKVKDNILSIYDQQGHPIAAHPLSQIKGQQVRNSNHKRNHSQKIRELIDQTSCVFSDQALALRFLETIHQQMPRYTRDQVGLIAALARKYPTADMDRTLVFCIENNLFQATDFESVLLSLKQPDEPFLQPQNKESTLQNPKYHIQPQTSKITDYKQIFS